MEDEDRFSRRAYPHLYFNSMRRVEQDSSFDKNLFGLTGLGEADFTEEGLSENVIEKAHKYLLVRHHGAGCTVALKECMPSCGRFRCIRLHDRL